MKINTNIAALRTINSLNSANNNLNTALQRLSSGFKINSAADDPAGFAISNKLETLVQGLQQANNNSMDGISMTQTAEGALSEVHSMLNRMAELTTKAANGTYSSADKEKIQDEIDQLVAEITKLCEHTEFNNINIFNSENDFILQVGANVDQTITIPAKEISMEPVMQQIRNLDASDPDANKKVNEAIDLTSKVRSKLGAYQNRLEHTVTNLDVSEENMSESVSRIKDTDMAEEMSTYTQCNVLSQAAVAMLSQANQIPQQVLQILNS